MTKKTVKFDLNPLFSGPSLRDREFSGSPFRLVPVADIDVDPEQPRRVFGEDSLRELAESIREYGVLSPILIRPTQGGTFRLVAGERRLRACKMVGIEAIPAILDVGPEDDSSILAKQLVENLQREDLSSLERALAIGQLRDSFKLSVRDIAKQLGLSKSLIQRSIEVLQLPDDLQAALIAGASESKILLLSQIKNRQLRKELLQKLEELSRKQIEQIVSKGREKTSKVSHGGTDKKSSKKMSTADKNIAEEIQRSIGTKVQVLRNAKGGKKGKVILEFYSDSDLDEIYRRLSER